MIGDLLDRYLFSFPLCNKARLFLFAVISEGFARFREESSGKNLVGQLVQGKNPDNGIRLRSCFTAILRLKKKDTEESLL
jgi:hypothetical protein